MGNKDNNMRTPSIIRIKRVNKRKRNIRIKEKESNQRRRLLIPQRIKMVMVIVLIVIYMFMWKKIVGNYIHNYVPKRRRIGRSMQ